MADAFDNSVKVHGLDELARKLRALPVEIAGKGATGPLAAALREAANVIKPEAIRLAPKVIGRLAGAIKVRRARNPESFKGRPNEVYHVGVDMGRKRNDLRGAWYWWFVEAGTVKMAARPYLRPAYESKAGEAIQTFRGRLARRIELIEQRLSRSR